MEMDTLLPPIPEVNLTASSSDESSSASGGELEQLLRSHSLVSTSPPAMLATPEKLLDLSTTSSSSDTSNELPGMSPVFFQLLPSGLQCEEGERLLLSCQVMAGTQCQIRWTANEKIISENTSRTRRHYNPDTGICFIIIDPTLTTDSGLYRLIIANRNGQAQSTCQVHIQPRQLPAMPDDELSTRLTFEKPLPATPVVCRDGDTIQLTCIVHGRRPIQIRWFKDEQRIIVDEKQQHTRQTYFDAVTGKSTLTIHDIYPGDSGVYRCEASNVQGRESTSTTLDVSRMSIPLEASQQRRDLSLDVQYDVDSEISSASFASGPPSDHEEMPGSHSYPSFDDKALYEESRRLVADLDARIADLSSEHTTATIEDDQQHRSQHGKVNCSLCMNRKSIIVHAIRSAVVVRNAKIIVFLRHQHLLPGINQPRARQRETQRK